jgi:hypothetical protein
LGQLAVGPAHQVKEGGQLQDRYHLVRLTV